MEYKIVSSSGLIYPTKLDKEVNEEIKNGFVPFGGIGVTSDSSNTYFYQAMVKEHKKDTRTLKCPDCYWDLETFDNGEIFCTNEDCAFQIEAKNNA